MAGAVRRTSTIETRNCSGGSAITLHGSTFIYKLLKVLLTEKIGIGIGLSLIML
jgi:hypothetical protein